jgi:cold shock CspA family protein
VNEAPVDDLPRGPQHVGVVASFDEHVGLGVITGDDGVDYPFHCIEIADGSRTIAVGAEVTFAELPKLGRVEAADITP